MTPHPRLAAAIAGCLLLAGCTNDPGPVATPSPTSTASASGSTNSSPTSTLPAEQQQAVDEATAVILAYEQLLTDLLADPDPRLNDLNNLVTDPQLGLDLDNTSKLIRDRETVIESAGPITIASVDPVDIDLKGDPPTIVLEVCLDSTATSGTYKGEAWTGPRQLTQYRVVKTTYLPDPGWAVAKVLPPIGFDQPQPC